MAMKICLLFAFALFAWSCDGNDGTTAPASPTLSHSSSTISSISTASCEDLLISQPDLAAIVGYNVTLQTLTDACIYTWFEANSASTVSITKYELPGDEPQAAALFEAFRSTRDTDLSGIGDSAYWHYDDSRPDVVAIYCRLNKRLVKLELQREVDVSDNLSLGEDILGRVLSHLGD